MAHILPAKKDSNKPVIVRFYSRFMRSLVFRYRKNFAPREEKTAGPSGGAVKAPKMKYSFFEDLSKETYAKLTEIKREPEVQSAWTVSGSIRFKTKNSERLYTKFNPCLSPLPILWSELLASHHHQSNLLSNPGGMMSLP